MSKLLNASLLALISQQSNAITLRTLLENQISASTSAGVDSSARLQEAAVSHVARDIQQLAQIQDGEGDEEVHDEVDEGYLEIAKLLVDMTRDGKFEELKACMIDVQNGTYQASKEAQLATGMLDEQSVDNSQADILIRDTPVIDANTTLTSAVDGAQIPFVVPDAAEPVQQEPQEVEVVENPEAQAEDAEAGDQGDQEVVEPAAEGEEELPAAEEEQELVVQEPAADDNQQADAENTEAEAEQEDQSGEQQVQVTNTAEGEIDDDAPDDDNSWLTGWV